MYSAVQMCFSEVTRIPPALVSLNLLQRITHLRARNAQICHSNGRMDLKPADPTISTKIPSLNRDRLTSFTAECKGRKGGRELPSLSGFAFFLLLPLSANPEERRRRRSIYVWLSTFARLPLNARSPLGCFRFGIGIGANRFRIKESRIS